MDKDELDRFFLLLRQRSRELAPDYPDIDKDMEPWEHLWAITSNCEGSRMTIDDCHKFIDYLLQQLGWSKAEGVEHWKRLLSKARNEKAPQ